MTFVESQHRNTRTICSFFEGGMEKGTISHTTREYLISRAATTLEAGKNEIEKSPSTATSIEQKKERKREIGKWREKKETINS